MNDPTILPVKPGSLTKSDKAALRSVGVVVIEHKNPSELRLIRPHAEIDSSALLMCALKALASSNDYSTGKHQREQFTLLVAKVLESDKP